MHSFASTGRWIRHTSAVRLLTTSEGDVDQRPQARVFSAQLLDARSRVRPAPPSWLLLLLSRCRALAAGRRCRSALHHSTAPAVRVHAAEPWLVRSDRRSIDGSRLPSETAVPKNASLVSADVPYERKVAWCGRWSPVACGRITSSDLKSAQGSCLHAMHNGTTQSAGLRPPAPSAGLFASIRSISRSSSARRLSSCRSVDAGPGRRRLPSAFFTLERLVQLFRRARDLVLGSGSCAAAFGRLRPLTPSPHSEPGKAELDALLDAIRRLCPDHMP